MVPNNADDNAYFNEGELANASKIHTRQNVSPTNISHNVSPEKRRNSKSVAARL